MLEERLSSSTAALAGVGSDAASSDAAASSDIEGPSPFRGDPWIYRITAAGLGGALIVFLIGATVILAVNGASAVPERYWQVGGAVSGALLGLIAPDPRHSHRSDQVPLGARRGRPGGDRRRSMGRREGELDHLPTPARRRRHRDRAMERVSAAAKHASRYGYMLGLLAAVILTSGQHVPGLGDLPSNPIVNAAAASAMLGLIVPSPVAEKRRASER